MIQKPSKKKYFRSFEEFIGDPQFEQAVDQEFGAAAPAADGLSRRRWLQLMGASMAFGSMVGCRMGEEHITPFVFRPQNRVPGIPDFYATSFDFGGVGRPVVAKSSDGRPIKLDGNPDHPNGGGSDSFTQAMILELYDPDRSRSPRIAGEDANWDQLMAEVKSWVGDGSGVAVLSAPDSSPTLARLKKEFSDKHAGVQWFEFASISDENVVAGSKMAFGKPYRQNYRLEDAKIIVSLDADPIGNDLNATQNIAGFTKGRDADHHKMSRYYCVESKLSKSGAFADHHLPLQVSQFASFIAALEAAIDAGQEISVANAGSKSEKIFAAMVNDLRANSQGGSVVIGGSRLSAELNAQICRINDKLGSFGSTIDLVEVADKKSSVEQIAELAGAIGSAKVDTLLIFGGNPVYSAPVDLEFAEAIGRVENSVHFSYHFNETSDVCKAHGNLAHALESWGDSRASDGSWLVAQPLIRPLFDGRSSIEVFAAMLGKVQHDHAHDHDHEDDHDRDHDHDHSHVGNGASDWLMETAAAEFDLDHHAWQHAIHDGFIEGSVAESASASLQSFEVASADTAGWKKVWDGDDVEFLFVPGSVYDGRFANNGWLQELPDFLTKLTWDNAAHVSPKTAARLGLAQGKKATFNVGDLSVQLPVNVVPGMAHGVVASELGYGRKMAGRIGGDAKNGVESVGVDIGQVRTTKNWNVAVGVGVSPSGTSYKLATTQEHFRMDSLGQNEINRRVYGDDGDAPLIREGSYDSYLEFMEEHEGHGHGGDGHGGDGHGGDGQGGDGHDDADHDAANSLEGAAGVTGPRTVEDGHDDHGHHHAKWPSSHHLHFQNVDITPRKYSLEEGHKWGMSIDLNKCVGCNACVTACQAENNIPIVGKEEVIRGRELHWMRIDRYFVAREDDEFADEVEVSCQPVACMHCEKAPCETVCPVAATTHSREGLNDMVYNRCIGTRYCGNNCPYKVRRFNYLNYSEARTFLKYPDEGILSKGDRALRNLMMNPEVTIRSRGVMEKCTYCVQRIQHHKIEAKNDNNREIGPNEIKTACQDACAAEAIKFGDLHNPAADVTQMHNNHRSYVLLEEMNNFPRTRYLARVRNPHPEVVAGAEIVASDSEGSTIVN